jgi:hypothetical protein
MQCRIQWDKAEVIHREDNRITTDERELVVMRAREHITHQAHTELLL